MPGPGGGSNSGGGHSSGSYDNDYDYDRGYHHRGHHHRHYHGYSRRGGCSSFITTIFVVILCMLLWYKGGSNDSGYNEEVFQDYANSEYKKAFKKSTAYEDNILIVFLTTEDADEYHYIGWVGDHINYEINCLFGNEKTELGRAMNNSINKSGYSHSLDTNLVSVVNRMTDEVEELKVDSFTCSENHKQVESKLVNYTELELTEELVNKALKNFTDKTNIPIVVVVEDSDDVF